MLPIALAIVAGATSSTMVNAGEMAQTALDFELAGERQFVRLSELPPRTTLINFWRSDCPPCVREMPQLAELARRGEIRVITVAVQRPYETERAPAVVAASLHPPILSLHAPGEVRGLLARFGNRTGALPYTIILNPERHPCASHTGELQPAWLDQSQARCRTI